MNLHVSGYAGALGAAGIAANRRDELMKKYRADFIDRAINYCPENASVFEDGYLGELYRIAQERKCGIEIALKKIPVLQSTIEICEQYMLNPYRLKTDAQIILSEEKEIPGFACIGRLTGGRDKIITDKSSIEYINKP